MRTKVLIIFAVMTIRNVLLGLVLFAFVGSLASCSTARKGHRCGTCPTFSEKKRDRQLWRAHRRRSRRAELLVPASTSVAWVDLQERQQ